MVKSMPKTSYDDEGPEFRAHEERIQRLELGRIEIAEQLGKNTSALEHLTELTKEGFGAVKLCQDQIAEQVKQLSTARTEQELKVKQIAAVLDKKAARWTWVKKHAATIVAALMGASVAVFGSEIGKLLWALIH